MDRTTTPTEGRLGARGALGPGMTTFVVVDLILVLSFFALLVMALTGAGGSATTASPAPSEVAEASPEASAPEAPADAETLAAFVLPSGNIWCAMTQTSATCTVLRFTFTPPAVPEGCTGTVGNVLTLSVDGPSLPCQTGDPAAPPEGAPVLEYGQASTVGELTCHSSTNGATCRHNPTGSGFSVARGGYTFW